MDTTLLAGIGIIAIGAFTSGSFSMPFEKTKEWKWENYWLIYSLFGYVLVPILSCFIFCSDFIGSLAACGTGTLLKTFLLGIAYGICNLTFGMSLRYLGVSLGFMLSLGLMMVFGTIVPPFLDGRLSVMMQQSGGTLLLIGLLIAALGVAVSAYAGYQKDKLMAGADSELNFTKGLLLALFVGVTGASQALGIEQGGEIAAAFADSGTGSLFLTLPIFTVLFFGSFCITLIWCLVMAKQNGTLSLFVRTKEISLSANYLFSGLAGFLWFVNMIFYGMGKSMMGTYSFTAWGILMSLTIVFATLWGLYRGEWKVATPSIYRWMYAGLFILVVSSFIIGMSGEG